MVVQIILYYMLPGQIDLRFVWIFVIPKSNLWLFGFFIFMYFSEGLSGLSNAAVLSIPATLFPGHPHETLSG